MATAIRTEPTSRFDLTPQQRRLAKATRTFAREEIAPHAVDWDQRRHFPVDVIRAAAELGMCGIYVNEEHGGSGMGRLDAAVIIEALATGCPTVAAYISIHNMVTWMVDAFGSEDQRAEWVPKLTSAEALGAYCLTESDAGSDAAALVTRAQRDGDDYLLNGEKQFISGAGAAGLYLVMARTGGPGPGGISAFLVPDGTPGLSFGRHEAKLGWNAQPTRAVRLQDVRLPESARLGAEGGGFKIALGGLNGGRLNIGAASLGGGQAALDIALAYTAQRRAFGATLSALQTVQFQLVDMATELEAARALLWRAAAAVDAGDGAATRLCAMAKQFATDAGLRVADRALQLHGGHGVMADTGVEKLMRDLRIHQIVEGTNEIMRLIVAREIVPQTR